LCDCFETKRDGVRHILAAVAEVFGESRTRVWSRAGRFVAIAHANESPISVAAANWHALATYAGRFASDGPALLVDVGSTTTDVIPLMDGKPVPNGQTDPERLRSRELVYTGVRRTPLCALLGSEVAAEFFATTHDAYLVLGMIPEDADDIATADRRTATVSHAHARLARMMGGDPEITPQAETSKLARRALECQRTLIATAMNEVGSRLPEQPRTLILSGSGEFLARASLDEAVAASQFSLTDKLGPELSEAACAYALAVLSAEVGT
jgi:probable H4MPT-linked C1 transfer pathway protein